MNILQIIPSLNLGGAEVLVVKMSILLKKMGHKVTLLTFVPNNNHLTILLHQNNIEIIVASQRTYMISKYYSLSNIIFVANYLKKHKFDLIHAHLTPAQVCMAFIRFMYKNKIPLITTEHNTYNRRRKIIFKPFDYFLYSQFDKVIAISQATKNELVKWVPNVEHICDIIHNGIDISEFSDVKKSGNKKNQQEALIVLSIGRFDYQKGYDILLKAFSHTEGMTLYLVGDGVLRKQMEDLSKDLNINDKTYFLGHRNDIPALLANADIYVQSSLFEGFGIATLEAMASGLPVIISDVPGLADIVGEAGLVFPNKNINRLTDALMRLASDKMLREKLSILGRERSLLFSLKNTTKKYLKIYEKMLEK